MPVPDDVPDDVPDPLLDSLDAVPLEVRDDWERLLRNQVADVWGRPGLSPRNRSIVTVTGLTVLRCPTELRAQVRLARTNGLSRVELCEVMMQISGYGGLGPALEGLTVLKEVFDAEPPEAAEPVVEGGSWLPLEGRHQRSREIYPLINPSAAESMHSRTAEYPIHGGSDRAQFSPDGTWLDWMHDTSFGDLWARPHLTLEERERVVTAVLVVLGRDIELTTHLRASIGFGTTFAELGEAIMQLAPYAGFPIAVGAMIAARQVQLEMAGEG